LHLCDPRPGRVPIRQDERYAQTLRQGADGNRSHRVYFPGLEVEGRMDIERLRAVLEDVRSGCLPVDEAMGRLRDLPYEDLGFAKLDHHRALRNGFPEVIFSQGKETTHILAIAHR